MENVLHSASVVSKGKRILSKDLPNTLISEIEKDQRIQDEDTEPFSQEKSDLKSMNAEAKPPSVSSLQSDKIDQQVNFGEINLKNEEDDSISTAPSSISSDEGFDIAYAHARKKTDRNLIETVEKEIIQRALKECGGNQVKASALLGITRATLRKRIDVFEIRY